MKKILTLIAIICVAGSLHADDKAAPSKPRTTTSAPKQYTNVNAEAFDKLRQTETNAVVLDVRTKDEYQEGHIPGSVLIDFNSPDFEKQVSKLDKSKTYLVHCASGGRSARACKKMDALNFSKLYNLEGGMNAWEKAGKPVEK